MSPFVFLLVPALACLLFALMLFGASRRAARQRRYAGAGLRVVAMFAFLAAAVGLGVLAAALYHYLRLDGETRVAEIALRKFEPQRWSARLETADGQDRSFELRGVEWEVDARLVRW